MSGAHIEDDVVSEAGDPDLFRSAASQAPRSTKQPGLTRNVESGDTGWGRGPLAVDKRKFRYDVNAAIARKGVAFSASKVDRLDADKAGDLLHRIHQTFAIQSEVEERIHAFDKGLWYEHAVNGGSTLQAERGTIRVDKVEFDIPVIVKLLGIDSRRFFRAYADEIADCLREILAAYDPYDPESAEMHAAIMQVAVARGLQKYPYLIHDSSDAGVRLSVEERMALQASKQHVITSTVNAADTAPGRVGQASGFESAAAVHMDH